MAANCTSAKKAPVIDPGDQPIGIFSIIPGKSIKLYGITQMKSHHPQWYREDLMTLFDLLVQKRIQPVISQRLPLTQAAQAHVLLERSAVTGKIILVN